MEHVIFVQWKTALRVCMCSAVREHAGVYISVSTLNRKA